MRVELGGEQQVLQSPHVLLDGPVVLEEEETGTTADFKALRRQHRSKETFTREQCWTVWRQRHGQETCGQRDRCVFLP